MMVGACLSADMENLSALYSSAIFELMCEINFHKSLQ